MTLALLSVCSVLHSTSYTPARTKDTERYRQCRLRPRPIASVLDRGPPCWYSVDGRYIDISTSPLKGFGVGLEVAIWGFGSRGWLNLKKRWTFVGRLIVHVDSKILTVVLVNKIIHVVAV